MEVGPDVSHTVASDCPLTVITLLINANRFQRNFFRTMQKCNRRLGQTQLASGLWSSDVSMLIKSQLSFNSQVSGIRLTSSVLGI